MIHGARFRHKLIHEILFHLPRHEYCYFIRYFLIKLLAATFHLVFIVCLTYTYRVSMYKKQYDSYFYHIYERAAEFLCYCEVPILY